MSKMPDTRLQLVMELDFITPDITLEPLADRLLEAANRILADGKITFGIAALLDRVSIEVVHVVDAEGNAVNLRREERMCN